MRKNGAKEVAIAIRRSQGFHNSIIIRNTACVFEKNRMFLQGLLVEGTSYRQTFYIWEIVYPLFHPNSNLSLNFSRRIGQGKMFEGSAKDVSDQVASCIHDDEVLSDRLFGTMSNKDFLAIEPLIGQHPENFPVAVVFDVATVMALENMLDHASRLLQHIWEKRSVCTEDNLLHSLVKYLLNNMADETSVRGIVDIVVKCNRGHILAR